MVVCPRSEQCWEWARVYMNYCICDAKDLASFSLGMLSVLSWSVAEVPQIITNYKTKTTEGISAAFLLTWVLGDLFNLFGCLLEPATTLDAIWTTVTENSNLPAHHDSNYAAPLDDIPSNLSVPPHAFNCAAPPLDFKSAST
ncbi:putative vacuolar amino acid transporter [Nymphaea thermarum]|nr:putative vacuolar amino acid transporter [Nymphaea thermarum]